MGTLVAIEPKTLLLVAPVALVCTGVALAALLPGTFVVAQAEKRWADTKSLVVDREVTRHDGTDPTMERVWWRDGRIRVDGASGAWVYALGRPTTSSSHRPGVIDAVFLTPQGQLERLVRTLGIDLDHPVLDRAPSTDGTLPFDVIYRLGSPDRPAAPLIEITKDTWTIRTLQFRESNGGHLWRAEYQGHGRSSLLPPWLPSRVTVFRDGILYETLHVLRRVDLPVPSSLFESSLDTETTPAHGG